MTAKGVLVARDLTPSETAGLDLDLVTGVVLAEGSPTSHAAILARARDIPVVVAAGPDVLSIPDGTVVLLDGARGELHVDPSPEVLEEYRRRAAQIAEQRDRQLALAEQPAASRDGIPFVVAANLGLGGRRPRRARGGSGRCRTGAHRVPLPRPELGSRRRGAAGCLRRDRRGDGRAADHPAHPGRRRGQAASLPADAGGGEPVPRPARDPAQPRAPRPAARPDGGDLSDGAALPDQHHDPDGVHTRRADRGASGPPRGGRTGGPASRAARRHHDRGAVGRAQDRRVPAARRLREHRHQRPDAVHPGRRARQRRRCGPVRRPGPGGAPTDRPRLPGGTRVGWRSRCAERPRRTSSPSRCWSAWASAS